MASVQSASTASSELQGECSGGVKPMARNSPKAPRAMLETNSAYAPSPGAAVNSHGCRALRVASKKANARSRRTAISTKMSRKGCRPHAGQAAWAVVATARTALQRGQK